jgi:hypothetical protein
MTLQQEDSRAAWGTALVLTGVVLGFVGALVAIRARQAMLYEGDPSTPLAVVAGSATRLWLHASCLLVE